MKTLLLVEDDSLLAATEGHWLEKAGYNVIHAPTGEKAIKAVSENKDGIDLILMDINLGSGLDGTDAAREILSEHDIPILFLSSHTEKEVVAKTEEITSYGYVVKDSKDVVLLASIKMAFKLYEANKSLKIKDEALERSQSRLRRAEFISGAGNWELRLESGRIIGSEGTAKVYGLDFAESNISDVQKIVLPEYRSELENALKNLIENGTPYNVVFKIKKADSGKIIDIRSTAEYDKEEGIVFGVIKDITKRKIAEDAIRYERNLLRILIDNLPNPIFFKDSAGLYVLNNRAHLESMGVESQLDVIGKTPLDFYETKLGAGFHNEELEIIHTGKSIKDKEEKLKHPVTGETIWHLANKIPIVDDEGKVSGIVGIIQDITERKREEQAIIESEHRWRAAIEGNNQGLWDWNTVTNEVYYSPLWKKMLGYDEDDIKPHLDSWSGLVHPDDMPAIMEKLEKNLHGETPYYSSEHRIKCKDGTYKWILDQGNVLSFDDTGKPLRMIGTHTDISIRKNIEEKLTEMNEIFRLFMKYNPLYVFIKDSSIRTVYLSENYEKMLHRPVSDLIGKTMDELFPSDLSKRMIEDDKRILSEGVLQEFIEELDGRIYSTIKFPIFINGEAKYLAGYSFDITERKEAEIQVKESEQIFAAAFHNSLAMISLSKLEDGTYLDVNETFLKVTGYSRHEVIGKSSLGLNIFAYPEDRQYLIKEIKKKGFIDRFECQIRIKSGQIITTLFSSTLVNIKGKSCLQSTMMDITERKSIEEGLRKFKISIDRSSDAIFITDKNGIIEYVNSAFEKIYGYKSEEAIGETPRLIKPGTLAPEFWSKSISNKSVTGEFQNIRKDGHIITIEGSNNPVVNDHGEIIGFLAIHRDISERKRDEAIQKIVFNVSTAVITTKNIEELISIIRDQLGSLMDTTNFYIAFYDKDTDTLSTPFAKDEKDEISSWPAEKSATGLVIKNQKTIIIKRDDITQLAAADIIDVIGTPSEIWIGVPLRVGTEVTGAIVVQDYNDPTAFDSKSIELLEFVSGQIGISIQRKQIETALHEKQAILSEAQRIARIGSWNAVPDTGKFSWSDQMYKVFDVLPNVFRPSLNSIIELIHPDDRGLFKRSLEKQFSGEPEEGIEFRIKGRDTSTRYLNLTGAPRYNDEGTINGAIGAVQDITEQKLAEFQLKKYTEELKSINATKDKFFSIISHDLKNPFHSINSALKLLISEEDNLTADEKKIFMSGILNASGKAYSLLENLLVWSRNQSGQIEYFPEKISLSELSLSSVDQIKNSAVLKNITINDQVGDGFTIRADWNMLQTVMRNLLTNAIKFTNENGKIDITATAYDHTVEVSIVDNGVGIHPDNIERLFKIDKQFTTPGTKSESGSGLGLILCKDFIERNGGKINVESRFGSGSKFSFTLPLEK